jgi:hypothetical protein
VIGALMVIAVAACSYWWMCRCDGRFPRATPPVSATAQRAASTTTALGLQDEPDQCRVTGGTWTELDERQLIRLLMESAPINPPATNTIHNAVPQVEHVENTDTP